MPAGTTGSRESKFKTGMKSKNDNEPTSVIKDEIEKATSSNLPKFAPEKEETRKTTAKNEKKEFDSGMKIPDFAENFDEDFDTDETEDEPGNETEEQENDFPSEISNKKKKSDKHGIVTGGAASLNSYNHKKTKEYIGNLQDMAKNDSDKKFLKNIEMILAVEQGYVNHKNDIPTNFGVTQGIYNTYRKEKGLKKQDIKNITIEEAIPIYYKYFWKPSGAEKLEHPLDYAYFDMYVNSPPKDAKKCA